MVAAIKASARARDFTETALAEPFFRAITRQALAAMLEFRAEARPPANDAFCATVE